MSIMDLPLEAAGLLLEVPLIIWRIKTPMEAERRCTAI
jgi:hypothetical protein